MVTKYVAVRANWRLPLISDFNHNFITNDVRIVGIRYINEEFVNQWFLGINLNAYSCVINSSARFSSCVYIKRNTNDTCEIDESFLCQYSIEMLCIWIHTGILSVGSL